MKTIEIYDRLKKESQLSFAGLKALLNSDAEYEVVLIDAIESPIERPKKRKNMNYWLLLVSYSGFN